MDNTLYVGNLPFSTNEEALKELFSQQGTVLSARIVTDAYYGRSKGFGFVEMENEEQAARAIEKLNDSELQGRTLRVDKARPRKG